MPRYSDTVQCFCGDASIHPDDADFVVKGTPCCSQECYETAKQGTFYFGEGQDKEQFSLAMFNDIGIVSDYDRDIFN